MLDMHRLNKVSACTLAAALCLPVSSLLAQPHRILNGNVSPHAQPRFDRGRVAPDTRMGQMSLMLRRSAAQQAELDSLLADQQNARSPRYHQWLTPEQFADRFGSPQPDIDRLVGWLQSSGFAARVSRGRDYIVFNGAAGEVEAAMRTQIHHYAVNGEMHYANASEPSLPVELAGLVAGVRGLDDFHPRPPRRPAAARPDFFSQKFPDTNVLAPDDLTTVYNINALYQAGIDGTGQTIAVVGESDIDLDDVRTFRTAFSLPANDPRKILVPGSKNPGQTDAMVEADLDLEWSGAIAANAAILYVFAEDVFDATFFVIDQALAPVVSFSFGACEANMAASAANGIQAEAQKAAALGITWIASSGDAGAAGCENQNGDSASATTRLSVNLPASLPEVTGVGGTEFNEAGGSFFAARRRDNLGTALSYIPERSWNDEAVIAVNGFSGFASSGGGASRFFSKPSWQAGPGVPADGARDVPDVSINASFFHDPYAVITGGSFIRNGGTSASAPVFAGVVALLNQYLVSRKVLAQPGLGNINPVLYQLAQTAPDAFHDITSGSNIVPCTTGSSSDCTTGSMGFTAGTGYDQVTGLGSVDAFALALGWPAQAAHATAHLVMTQFTAGTSARVGGSLSISMTVANQGTADAGAFETRAYFTTNGEVSTALPFVVRCDMKNLAAGSAATCAGSVTLGSAVTPGKYQLVAVADPGNAVPDSDPSSRAALASSGPLTVVQ